ncbi:hypothetical protein DIPPA_19421 [Diplonema papillatum]|nr:hypothetical protein DIPPA_14315 [Diplonema papillatum]KAJ9440411.1 hypothetical protein DIPPA_19421 [Diplonema papillatum]
MVYQDHPYPLKLQRICLKLSITVFHGTPGSAAATGLAVALEKYAAAGDVPSLELLKLLGVRDVHCAALRTGREPALALARDLPTVQWLVGHGGRVHYEYGNGTPFNKAVQRGDHALVAYMKSLG